MTKIGKSGSVSYDEIRIEALRDPKRAHFALKLAVAEYEKDNNLDVLLDTVRLVARAHGD